MENITQEQFLAFGAIGFAILGVALLVSFMVMAGTLKLSIAWLGNASPSLLACFGWLLAITFVNSFLILSSLAVFGETAGLLVTPLTWFVTLYMISTAADCGLLRAFGIWIVNSILSTIGLVAIVFVMTIPLAMIGAGINTEGENLQAEFEEVENRMAQMEQDVEAIDAIEFPEVTEVSFPSTAVEEVPAAETSPDRRSAEVELPQPTRESAPPFDGFGSGDSPPRTQQPPVRPKKQAVRRAADGSMINPFFQD